MLYILCQGTTDLMFVFPGDEEVWRRSLLALAISLCGSSRRERQTLMEWAEGGAAERNLYALGRRLHGGDELQRHNYLRDENMALQLTEGLPVVVSMAAPQSTSAIADHPHGPPCSLRTALLPLNSTSRRRSTRTAMEPNHHFQLSCYQLTAITSPAHVFLVRLHAEGEARNVRRIKDLSRSATK